MALTKDSIVTGTNMKMPIIGFGTWQSKEEEIERAINAALECGYRHIDTAFVYFNEAAIGKVLKKWFDSGKLRREDLFIVTKLPMFANRAEHVEQLLKMSLERLQLDYVDLYLIHVPTAVQFKDFQPFPKGEDGKLLLDMDTNHLTLWEAMEKQVDVGLTRAIGVSNFNQKQVKRIVDNCRIKPANIQVEMHIYLQQRELVKFCKDNGISVCAYAPLGSPNMVSFVKQAGFSADDIPKWVPMGDPQVVAIANKYDKTPAQILLRFLLQYGVAVIPKSTNPERIKANFDLFNFKLSEEDYNVLASLDKGEKGRMFENGLFSEMKIHPEYPF